MLDHFVEAGKRLLQAKTLVKQSGGSWLIWLEQSCELSERTAQVYMQAARAKSAAPAADLNLVKSLRGLAAQHKVQKSLPADKPKVKASPSPEHLEAVRKASKGRLRAKRRTPGTPKLKQNFIPNIPGYLEEMLLTMERCVIEYEIPEVDAVAKGVIAHRLKVEHFDEIISWLSHLKDKIHEMEAEELARADHDQRVANEVAAKIGGTRSRATNLKDAWRKRMVAEWLQATHEEQEKFVEYLMGEMKDARRADHLSSSLNSIH
jgi:hypothetical protein